MECRKNIFKAEFRIYLHSVISILTCDYESHSIFCIFVVLGSHKLPPGQEIPYKPYEIVCNNNVKKIAIHLKG